MHSCPGFPSIPIPPVMSANANTLLNYTREIRPEYREEISENLRNALAILELGGKQHEVTIKVRRRSNPQNDLFHVLCRSIADKTGHSEREVKDWAKSEFIGSEIIEIAGKPVSRLREISALSEHEFSLLIQRMEALDATL